MAGLSSAPLKIEWASASSTLAGETESGDQCLVAEFPDGALAAVVDGLGHGPEAAAAAQAAVASLARHPADPVLQLLQDCHADLRKTRGAVISLVSFDLHAATITWAGVGDVEGVMIRGEPAGRAARESILLRSGVVGYQLPRLRETTHSLGAGDTVLLATDGVGHRFTGTDCRGLTADEIARDVMDNHRKGTDDALVLAICCVAAS